MSETNSIIPADISRKILTVGEYHKDRIGGGIASVLQTYSCYFEVFNFVASSRGKGFTDKLRYDLGGLFRMLFSLKGVEIVHIHTASRKSFTKHMLYAKAARLAGRKVIMHIHAAQFKEFFGESSPRLRKKIVRCLNEADKVIVLSNSWKEWYESIGVQSPAVLNNIVPRPQPPKDLQTGRQELGLLFLGEIGQRKGVFDLLKALSTHQDDFRGQVHLEIGGNKNEELLIRNIESLNIGDMVKFRGFVSGAEKADLLSAADIFALPSFNEGLPISILEAMSYGCAVISTPIGGIPEIVDESNGIMVTPGDSEEIATAIYRCLKAREDGSLEIMKKKSLEKIEAFLPETVMASLVNIYHSIIS